MNSRTSRDLPTPAPPSTVSRWQALSRTTLPNTVLEHGTLALAPDEGRVEAARKAGGVGEDVHHDEGVDRLAVLEHARPARLDDDRVAHEPVRRLPDQDLVRRRRLLEALGDVDGLSGDEQMPLRVVAGDHLAGVDADPVGQADAPARFELAVEDGECVAHLDGRPHRAQGVVLVEDRHAEHRHDRVTDVLLHDPAVPSDDGAQLAEVAREQVPERFRIEGEAEPRRVDEVGEEDRDRLADVRRRLLRFLAGPSPLTSSGPRTRNSLSPAFRLAGAPDEQYHRRRARSSGAKGVQTAVCGRERLERAVTQVFPHVRRTTGLPPFRHYWSPRTNKSDILTLRQTPCVGLPQSPTPSSKP